MLNALPKALSDTSQQCLKHGCAKHAARSSSKCVAENEVGRSHRLKTQAGSTPGGSQSRLIIPGGGGRPGHRDNSSNRIIIPGQDGASKGASIDTQGVPAPSTSQFRPPPGFMDTEKPISQVAQALDPAQARSALDRLRMMAGVWHELAKALPQLAASGYDSAVVEMETGLERAQQSAWAVAQQVHDSLQKLEKVPPEKMAYFDDPEGANMLYHLRFLPFTARPAVAEYIVDQQLDAMESGVLARAVKEQERREGEKEGFTSSPADSLAFKYYRDAIETRREEQRNHLIQKGLSVAETPSATAALERLLTGQFEATTETTDAEHAILEVVRLTGEEVEFRPVALVGEMAETSASLVAAAVGVSQSGPYNAFIMPAECAGQQFVALPAFRSLLLARSPVALSVSDCSEVPAILKAAKVRTQEDKTRQAGRGLVLFDRHVDDGDRIPTAFYVREKGSGCELVEGSLLASGEAVAGKVLFLCRPPVRNAKAKLDSYALMSL